MLSSRSRWDRPVPPVLVVIALIVAAFVCVVIVGTAGPTARTAAADVAAAPATTVHHAVPKTTGEVAATDPVGEADGALPSGATVFDSQYPAISRLDPALLSALRDAATHAQRAGVTFLVSSGWRSVRYQQQLLDAAVVRYGSLSIASRWVAPPMLSAHVAGQAIDIADSAAQAWLSRYGAAYGLCRIYANETWHFELRPEATRDGCPQMYPDAAHDPRMQR